MQYKNCCFYQLPLWESPFPLNPEHIHNSFQIFTLADLSSEDSFPRSWFPYKSRLPLATGGRKKCLISPFTKNLLCIFLLSELLGTAESIATVHEHTLSLSFSWIFSNLSDMMRGELENTVTCRSLLIALHCLTFPFIHLNPLRKELLAVVNEQGLSALSWKGAVFLDGGARW